MHHLLSQDVWSTFCIHWDIREQINKKKPWLAVVFSQLHSYRGMEPVVRLSVPPLEKERWWWHLARFFLVTSSVHMWLKHFWLFVYHFTLQLVILWASTWRPVVAQHIKTGLLSSYHSRKPVVPNLFQLAAFITYWVFGQGSPSWPQSYTL